MASTSPVVPTGPYMGFTLNDLTVDQTVNGVTTPCELTRYKTARKQSFSRLTASNINGQSFSFGARVDGTLDEWQSQLEAAISYLDPGFFGGFPAPTNSAVAVSR
jgi:hypothetical protein